MNSANYTPEKYFVSEPPQALDRSHKDLSVLTRLLEVVGACDSGEQTGRIGFAGVTLEETTTNSRCEKLTRGRRTGKLEVISSSMN
jgi:hypothetical protein